MNLIGAMLIMLSCTAAGIMKARSLSELDKTYGTLIAMLTLIKNEIVTLSAPLDEAFERAAGLANGYGAAPLVIICKVCQRERFRLLRSWEQALEDMTAPCSARQ